MSSGEAKPDSAIRIADSRYGTSSALTTNPARSGERTTSLPSVSVRKVSTRSALSAEVSSERVTSTRGIAGTGLKKCVPTTCSGRDMTRASFMTGREDVLVVKTASGFSTALSRREKRSSLADSSSVMASMTSRPPVRPPRSVV